MLLHVTAHSLATETAVCTASTFNADLGNPKSSSSPCPASDRDVEDTTVEIRGKSLSDIPIALDLFRKRNRRGFENPGQDMNWWVGRIHDLSSDAISVRDHERGCDRDVDVQKQQPGRCPEAKLIDKGNLLQLVAIFSV